MKFGSLFTGIGGIDFGFERAGMECAWQVEKDDYCTKVLEKHWPDVPKHDDIKTFTVDTSVNLLYNQSTDLEKELIDMTARKTKYDVSVDMYEKGLSIQDIAEYYGISRQAMWMILKRRGCEFRPNTRSGVDNHFYRGGETASDKAQNILETAIKKGLIQRKYICEECGEEDTFSDGRSAIQAHHSDYNKPLDVIWLCQKCHHEWHKNNKAIERKEVESEPEENIPTVDLIAGGFP
jgi:predicted HTH domain antitoxin/DNA-directed RNA polymerase subunit M/transcription elongation factor TFIIS